MDDVTEDEEEFDPSEMLDEAGLRRISLWVETVNKHIDNDDFDRKVVMESSEMHYKDDVPRPTSAEDLNPGNYHTVTIVQYDDKSA